MAVVDTWGSGALPFQRRSSVFAGCEPLSNLRLLICEIRARPDIEDRSVGAFSRMTNRHLLFDVAIKKSVERYVRRAGVRCLLVQFHEEAFEMRPKGFFMLVNRGVEGL
jgi:hypothetical protein